MLIWEPQPNNSNVLSSCIFNRSFFNLPTKKDVNLMFIVIWRVSMRCIKNDNMKFLKIPTPTFLCFSDFLDSRPELTHVKVYVWGFSLTRLQHKQLIGNRIAEDKVPLNTSVESDETIYKKSSLMESVSSCCPVGITRWNQSNPCIMLTATF